MTRDGVMTGSENTHSTVTVSPLLSELEPNAPPAFVNKLYIKVGGVLSGWRIASQQSANRSL